LFRSSVLDHAKNLLDLFFRRGGPDDENQIVITLFHGCLISICVQTPRPGKSCRGSSIKSGKALQLRSGDTSLAPSFAPTLPARQAYAGCTSSSPCPSHASGSFPTHHLLRSPYSPPPAIPP